MTRDNLVPKQITNSLGHATTVYVLPNDAGNLAADKGPFTSTPVSSVSANSPHVTSPSDLKNFAVEETKIRGHDALTVSFLDDPGRKFHLVHDDESTDDAILFIDQIPGWEANLESYENGGRGSYGSDQIMLQDGEPVLLDSSDMATALDDLAGGPPIMSESEITDALEYDDFDLLYLAADGRPVAHHVLPELLKDERAGAWIREHAVEIG